MIIPPSSSTGAQSALASNVLPAAVGALVGVRAVEGNGERQDEERASHQAGVVFRHSAMPPPLEGYGPDGRRVGSHPAEDEAEETGHVHGSEEADEAEHATASGAAEAELSEEDQRVIEEMRARDAEVRAHEAAHVAAGGAHVHGGATFGYETGPDGKQYAVEGEVGIDTAPVADDPQATAEKARTVRAAALAPANPSGADRAIAAKAAQMEAQAMVDLAAQQQEEAAGGGGTPWDSYVQQHQPEGSTPASSFSLVA